MKASIYLTSIGLLGSVATDILYVFVAKKCLPIFLTNVAIFNKCQYTIIGLSIWKHYIFIPMILISFALVMIPALILLSKKRKLENFHVKIIIYSILAFLLANYLTHVLVRIFI
jgi:hypothetical protein